MVFSFEILPMCLFIITKPDGKNKAKAGERRVLRRDPAPGNDLTVYSQAVQALFKREC
jgi:hypothetical protein